jgi:predicted transcriptional regulator
MLLYIVLLDRARVSMGNRDWADESGRVFIIYTIKSLGKKMHRSEMTIKTALSALDEKGLIVRTRQGGSRANRIYVRYPEG